MAGIAGLARFKSMIYMYFTHIITGIIRALIFPLITSIMAEWFTRRNRGLIFGLYMSCISIAHMAGIYIEG